MAAVVLTVGHERTITDPQTVADAGAEGAQARLRPASTCLDLKVQPVLAGAPLPLLILRRGGDEVGAAGPLLHREEEHTVAATVHHVGPAPLSSVAVSALFMAQSTVQEAPVPLQ